MSLLPPRVSHFLYVFCFSYSFFSVYSHTEADVSSQCLLEANVSTEVCLTVLDTLSIFIMGFKVAKRIIDHKWQCYKAIYIWRCGTFLSDPADFRSWSQPLDEKGFPGPSVLSADPSIWSCPQTGLHLSQDLHLQGESSESLWQWHHLFQELFCPNTWHIFFQILQFPCTFFDGRADMCASLCYEILKCCNSKLSSIRSDAAHLLYFLMKSNFDYTGRKSFVRTHLQVF